MARYIDADALGIGKADRKVFEKLEYADGWNSAIEIIANAPSADVVPRSEVEKAKQEVARKIFYLIDNYIEIVKTTVGFDLEFLINSIAELEKKYEVTKNEN